jgi:transcriptional regulator with XRE-family HTH domain/tetratricopeptide (TPR) repeat protein
MAGQGKAKEGRSARPNVRRIIQLRTKKGWNQEDLARVAALSKRTVENVENGRPANFNLHTLSAIATALNVAPEEVIISPADPSVSGRLWTPAVLCPLPPAPHFAGREEMLAELTAWATNPEAAERVIALVAVGGTGKTALAERVLSRLPLATPFGVFVWSFYEDRRIEAFLRTACQYFLGEVPTEASELRERLQGGLRADGLPHLLVLDGLEMVQTPAAAGRPRGELKDRRMRQLLWWLATGSGTRAKALVASRFPLPELSDWTGRGFRAHELPDLDPQAARDLLRRWRVQGPDDTLDNLAESVHRHALTLDVLGSYLRNFHQGDPARAPSFVPGDWAETDLKTAKLHRVLTGYAEQLQPPERDLMVRLSQCSAGIAEDDLDRPTAAGEGAASRTGCKDLGLRKLLSRLRDLGLVFRSDAGETVTFTAHPFLRRFFGGLLGLQDSKQIHDAVRAKLAAGLSGRADEKPTDPADLDRYEQMIGATRHAGNPGEAFNLYHFRLGGYQHLGWVVGDYARGLRILSAFSTDGTPATAAPIVPTAARAVLVGDWGLYAKNLGRLTTSREAFRVQIKLLKGNLRVIAAAREASEAVLAVFKTQSTNQGLSKALRNLSEVELLAGLWPRARAAAAKALAHAERADDDAEQQFSQGCIAVALVQMGLLVEARRHFAEANNLPEDAAGNYSHKTLWKVEFQLTVGDRAGARTELSRSGGGKPEWTDNSAWYQTLLGHCVLPDEPDRAHGCLTAARAYARGSDNTEINLRCCRLAAEIARCEREFDTAVSEVHHGIQLADARGFGRWSLDLRTELARIHIANNDPKAAIEPAEWVLKRSREEDCQYAWGVADSLHLLGVAHARLGDKQKAREYLKEAIDTRKPLEHPGLAETEDELRKLG